jgi:hypothetical protein
VSHDNESARATFYEETSKLKGERLHSAVANAIYELALRAIGEQDAEIARLRRQDRDQASEIARLRAGLDAYQGAVVMHCMERDMARIIGEGQLEAAADGAILRATDTGRELILRGGTWLPRE